MRIRRIKKKKSDPDQQLREKMDLNPHESEADPQPWFSAQALYLDPGSRPLGSRIRIRTGTVTLQKYLDP
jgi:hypothetical protein